MELSILVGVVSYWHVEKRFLRLELSHTIYFLIVVVFGILHMTSLRPTSVLSTLDSSALINRTWNIESAVKTRFGKLSSLGITSSINFN